jgi:hypothetical protein
MSLFPLFGDLGFKMDKENCADLRHRELRKIHALLLTLHGSRQAALLKGRRSSGFVMNLLIFVCTRISSKWINQLELAFTRLNRSGAFAMPECILMKLTESN